MSDSAPVPSHHGGEGLNLGKKVGPMPLGAWVGAIAAGLAISYYLRRHASASSSSSAADAAAGGTVAPTDASISGTGGAAVSTPGYTGNVSGPVEGTNGPDSLAITDNAMWRQQAVKWLVGAGVGAIQAEQAVANFLAGGTLTQEQADNINRVIAGIGPSPEAVPAISIQATPVAAPHPTIVVNHPPAKHHPGHKPEHPKPPHRKDTGKHTHPRR